MSRLNWSRTGKPSLVGRRCFLQSLALTSGAIVWNSGSPRGLAMEPLDRTGYSFKFSLAAYSYRTLLQGNQATMDLFGFVDDCALFGLQGTELTSYYFPKDCDQDYLLRLRHHCFRQGLDVSGTAVGNDFGFPPGDERTQQIENVKKWVRNAAVLGAPVIRIFAGHRKPDTTQEQSHELIVSGIEECCEYAGQHGVHLALENHGGPTSTATGLLSIVRDVRSPWFGVNLDTGNFHSEQVYEDLAQVAPYAVNVQVKVVISPSDATQKQSDFHRIASILREANYRGYIALEYEEQGNPREECRRYLADLQQAFANPHAAG